MAQAADLPLPYPEVARIDEGTLAEQSLAVAAALPARPLVLGGCCCAHVGAVEGVAARQGRVGLVWLDAHADLNTPETSPSGNEWGMPLRMLIDGGAVEAEDVVLLGARNLDPPEEDFIAASGLLQGSDGIGRLLAVVQAVYVALDADVLDPGEGVAVFMPEPDGLSRTAVEDVLRTIAGGPAPVVGAGMTGLVDDERNTAPLSRLAGALGL